MDGEELQREITHGLKAIPEKTLNSIHVMIINRKSQYVIPSSW